MSEEPRDRYEEEALRLVRLLSSMAMEKRVSIRSLERKMGVGDSVFSKVLRGQITPQVRHVLMIADALEVGCPELFARAYGLAQPRAARAAAPADEEGRLVGLLLRLGVIDAETARRALSSPEEP
jgi:transcriptional regulator with XRE-family HTH domain